MGADSDTDASNSQKTENNSKNNSNHSASAQTNRDATNSSASPSAAGTVNVAKRSVKPASSPTNTSSNINSSVQNDESSQDMIASKNGDSDAAKTVTTTNKTSDSISGQQRQQMSQPPQRKNQHASNDNSDSSAKQNVAPTKQPGKVLDQQGSSANASSNLNLSSDQAGSGAHGVHSVTSVRKNREGYPKSTFVMDAGTHGVGRPKEAGSSADVEQPPFGAKGTHRMRKPNSSMEYGSAAFSSPLDAINTFNGHANKSRDSSTGNVGSKEPHKHSVRNMNMRSENNSHQSNFYQQHGKSAPHQYQQHYNSRAHSHQQHSNQYHHYSHQSSNHNQEQLSRTNLYIKGLSSDTNDNDLFALCSQFGNIVSTKAILDKATNKCKGYGFVDFETAEAAEFAVNELQKQGILAHMARQQEADPTNLYIANLPQVMTESELENLLRPYGPVVSTRILVNQHRQPRGVGFARMETKEQCDNIIASLNGQPIKGSEEPLLIKFADGAGKKRSHQYQHRPLGSNVFVGDNLWRNSNNETNSYSVMNSGAGSRNFHSGSFDHARQNHHPTFSQNNETMMKQHQHMISTMAGFQQHQGNGGQPQHHQMHSMVHHVAGPNSTGSGGLQSAQHQSPMTHHHGPNQPSHSSNNRNQNQSSPYAGGSNFTLSAQQIGNSNDGTQWLHTSQAHQPYVIQPQILAPTTAMDPSMHYLNLANQMQGLQIGNPAVGGFLSPQQWQVWPGTVGGKHSGPTNNTNPGGNHSGYSDVD